MTMITIEGVGSFLVPNEKVQELMEWVNSNAVRHQAEGTKINFSGDDLING